MKHGQLYVFLFLLTLVPGAAPADPARIEAATARNDGAGNWTFSVTLSHGDTGWDDYADGWRVVDGAGSELGMRTLFHPHVEEQPFTRSLSSVAIPPGTSRVYVEARTNADGWGAERFPVDLPN
jgi:hypothetical protein